MEALIKSLVRRFLELKMMEPSTPQDIKKRLAASDIEGKFELSRNKTERFRQILINSRLWLGEDTYGNFIEYHNLLIKYLEFYNSGPEEFQKTEARLEKLKQNINTLLYNLNGKR